MQPVGTAVPVVCVRATVSVFNIQHRLHYTGETAIIYG
jgi:hypothetical protein